MGILLGASLGSVCWQSGRTSPTKSPLHCLQHWTDEFLKWDPTHFDNLTQISLPVESIWVPDILINEL